ncbi:MAG: TrmH family RNA methyltransferase [Flavobacteriaceae bacterium]|nr:TrmH family RNA methyltransferase [Flavobacteriaceae bacterium]
MQLTHHTSKFQSKTFPISVVCDSVTNAPNLGSLFRVCDAFGVEKLILCGDNLPLGRRMTKTSRATEKSVNFQVSERAIDVVKTLKSQGYQILSLEITDNSIPVNKSNFNTDKPMALIIGDENFGVSEAILNISDAIIHIDMFGQNSSMNVVQATNIALYEITKQFL